ncbi:Cell division and transport-associated protein TolA [Polynucleobacter meluiroseus]|uniref:Cell division and transport-associated protein TolA n=1 Tax=Polynucleobacter meluiroseus TaxID=1938814 RepID=A0A240E3G8_9BURK|nr:energy transducer TonB [Polynucleobacter meluiroseus]SNX29066.1 Cell division and transport-associated protein TolA [Polynucleobacter meluiroseus]
MNTAPNLSLEFSRGRLSKSESTKRAFSLSLFVHLGLIAFLVIGINWKTSTPAGVEVELWDATPPAEIPPPAPELKSAFKEEAADIAVKKKVVAPEPPKKVAAKEVIKPTPPVKVIPPKEVPKIVPKETPKKAEAPKETPKPALTPAQIKAEAEADKRRAANIASLRGLAANDGGTGGTVGSGVGGGGNAPPGWSDKVIKKVRANITFNADTFKGNKQTVIQVKLAPDGAILTKVMTSSSGDANWDQAVLSAIEATQTLPKDDNGQFPTLTPELKLKPK